MNRQDDNRLADQLNKNPIVFADCTGPEIIAVFGIALVVGLIIGVAVGVILLPFMMGLILGLLISLGLAWLLLNFVANARNRYYENWLTEHVFLIKRNFTNFFSLDETSFVDERTRFGRGRRR